MSKILEAVSLEIRRDARGLLVFPPPGTLPFVPRHVYHLVGVPESTIRGAHAHRTMDEILIVANGSVTLEADNGRHKESVRLQGPAGAVRMPKMTWFELSQFSPGTVIYVLAPGEYDETQIIRSKAAFLEEVRAGLA